MQEKMNIADKPSNADSSEEEVEDVRAGPTGTVLDTVLESKDKDTKKSSYGTIGGETKSSKSNDLPEDREIHSDDE
jgi:hypothetical protein